MFSVNFKMCNITGNSVVHIKKVDNKGGAIKKIKKIKIKSFTTM